MATAEQCERALHQLADRLTASDTSRRTLSYDRSLTCTIRDLDIVFSGRLKDGQLLDIGRTTTKDAHVRLTMGSDDLVALVDGTLKLAPALATGRVKIEAGVLDLVRLRAMF